MYQHDVDAAALRRTLSGVVESCVNMVGVDVNSASVPLLTRVAGIGPSLAAAIVAHRAIHVCASRCVYPEGRWLVQHVTYGARPKLAASPADQATD
jgi:hypothetical protein